MKKFVKPLVIAASVAAIAGVGAVSFAAWTSGNTDSDATVTANMGSTSVTAGFVVTNAGDQKTLSFSGTDKLVPVDQATPGTGNTTMLTAALGDIQVPKGSYKFTLSATTDLKLYYQVATSASAPTVTAETGTTVTDKEDSIATQLTGTGWTALGSDTADVAVTDNVKTVSDLNLYIILVSSDTADMNATAALTLTLTYTAPTT